MQPERHRETLRERIVRIAKGEIGDVETEGNNAGPAPRKYLASTGITTPAPYCGAGIYWCYLQAGDTLLPARPFALAATWSRKANRIWGKDAPDTLSILPADVTCHYFKNMGRFAHVNLVEMDAGKYIKIIGFNTTDGFNRDGTGVYAKVILKSQVTCVTSWAGGAETTMTDGTYARR